jgi:hypothetical protein
MIKHRLARVRDEDGFAMVIAVALITLLAILAVTLMTSVEGDNKRSRTFPPRDGAYQAAEAGINAYTAKLLENPLYYNQFEIMGEATRSVGAASSTTGDVAFSGYTNWSYASKDKFCNPNNCLKGSGYQYDIEVCPPMQSCSNFGSTQIPYTRILSTGRPVNNSDKRTWRALEMDVRPFSLSHFQMFTAGDYSVGSGGNTYGPIYAQGDISHAGTAYADVMAEGTVSGLSASDLKNGAKIYYGHGSQYSDDIRKAPGLATKPNFNDFLVSQTDTKGAAQSGGIYLNDSSQDAFKLVFQPDGTIQISKCKKAVVGGVTKALADTAPTCGTATSYAMPSNGAIFGEQSLLVEGTVHGRATVVSAQDIIVSNNLLYADYTNDILGLIGNHDVLVPNYAPQDLEWHSAVIAQTGARKAYTNNGDHDTLNFYGSVTSYGSPSMTMFRTRNYNPEPSLSYLSPPWFPVLNNQLQILVEREVSP